MKLKNLFEPLFSPKRQEGLAPSQGLKIWYECFGKREDPAFLLIMGNGGQAIFWPTEFCQKLAKAGFYVIRYDLRDSGLSSAVGEKEKPYNLFELAKDATSVLDALNLEKAHLLGLSMGAAVAELLSVHFPQRVLTLSLLGASADFDPIHRALEGKPLAAGSLSGPKDSYLEKLALLGKLSPEASIEEHLEHRLQFWQLLNGSRVPFKPRFLRALHLEFFKRQSTPVALGRYRQAIALSKDEVRLAHSKVTQPTLILHGSEDPLFGLDHPRALNQLIKGSNLIIINGLGHLPNPYFSKQLVRELAQHAQSRPY